MKALEGDETDRDLEIKKPQFDPSILFPKRSKAAVHFDAFPMGRWEVVWLGDVGFRLRHRMHTQPTITVVIRSLDGEDTIVTEIQVPVAQLFALHLGSIWQDKVLQEECSQLVEIRNIAFKSDRAIPCAVGIALEEELNENFMLPFSDFPYHSGHTKGWCLRIALPNAIYIMPALELIRFYFGSSGSLLKHVFNPGFDVSRIATNTQLNVGRAQITLAHGIPTASAADVARIVFDSRTLAFAKLIGSSLQAAAATDATGKLYPRATLPFSGQTEMTVIGISVQSNSLLPRFVVQRIISCSAKFPFKSLQYVASGQVKQQTESTYGAQKTIGGESTPQSIRKRRTSGPLANTEPQKSKATQRLNFDGERRFPDLTRKTISRIDGDTPRQVQMLHLPPVAFGSTGNGQAKSDGQRCEPILSTDQRMLLWKFKAPTVEWAPFFRLLDWLSNQNSVAYLYFVPIDSRQAQPHYCSLPELIDEDGVLINDTLLVNGKRRLASAVNLQIGGNPVALLSLAPTATSNSVDITVIRNHSFNAGGALPAVAASLTCEDQNVWPISLPKNCSTEDIQDAGQRLLSFIDPFGKVSWSFVHERTDVHTEQ